MRSCCSQRQSRSAAHEARERPVRRMTLSAARCTHTMPPRQSLKGRSRCQSNHGSSALLTYFAMAKNIAKVGATSIGVWR